MKQLLLITVLSLTLVACERPDRTTTRHDADNTERNIRDRDGNTLTSGDQAENDFDRTITQSIRRALMAEDTLSTNAKNIKIITVNGVVTLRGPVGSIQERELIIGRVNNIQGVSNVDNQLEVTRNN